MEDEDSETAKTKFHRYIKKAREQIAQQEYFDALRYYKKAEAINSSEKLVTKIEKLTKFLAEFEADSDDDDDNDDNDEYENFNGYKIHKGCWERLYPYQREGVLWFWKLFTKKRGGILGDDMGLGKTIQVIAFLSGMFDQELVKNAIIVVPKSLMQNWSNEFENWAPGIRLAEFHGAQSKREKELLKVQKKNGVILTTYGMMCTSHGQFASYQGQGFIWDYIILDEGHKIKNPNKTSKGVRSVPANNHVILTGTPIQNNLSELWSLVDFVTEGKLLGTKKTFKTEFENPIVRARERDASSYEKRMGNEISSTLRKMIGKFFLRRTKAGVFGQNSEDKENSLNEMNLKENSTVDGTQSNQPTLDIKLSRKNDLIIWLYLSDIQLKIYQDFLQTATVREAMISTKSPLAQLALLKKIADHPRLLSSAACETLGLSEDRHASEDILNEESSKMQFLKSLVRNLKDEHHRVLIFSQSRKMLDIVEKVLAKESIKLLRFDGRILDTAERQSLINRFQTDSSITCLLLTTQVGSVGLNLTGADRVVIFDPSWNPGNDAQAVDRAYRIGQSKDVIIYRLITCGTIEEKIYRKQIFKDSISKQTTGSSNNPLRYFERNQLRELFILENPRISKTHGILKELNGERERSQGPAFERHLRFLKSLNIFGISDHGLVFSKEARAEVTDEYDRQIMERVKRAKDLVTSEVNLCDQVKKLSLGDKDVFKPSCEDIKRYTPKMSKTIEEPMEQASEKQDRFVIPDSPKTDPEPPINILARSDSIERVNQYVEAKIRNEDIITIEDSLNETPGDVNDDLDREEANSQIESVKIEDSFVDGSTLEDQCDPCEDERPLFEPNDNESILSSKNDASRSPELNSNDVQSEQAANQASFSPANRPDSDENEQSNDAFDARGERGADPTCAASDLQMVQIESPQMEDSYIQIATHFRGIGPDIIASPVLGENPRLIQCSNAIETNSDKETPIGVLRDPMPDFVHYRDGNNDDVALSDTDNESGDKEPSLLSQSKSALEDSTSNSESLNVSCKSLSHNALEVSSQESSASRLSSDIAANASSYVEVIDAACSPMSNTASRDASPYQATPVESVSPGNVRESRRSVRRSAIGLMYGLADESNESEVSVEVIDAACSPVSVQELPSDVLDDEDRNGSNKESSRGLSARLCADDIGLNEVSRLSDQRKDSLNPPVLSCSTPQYGQSVPGIEHMAVYEKRVSLHEALRAEKCNSLGGSSRRSRGSSRRSGGLDQFTGSGFLFSHSTLSEEVKYSDQKPFSKLVASNNSHGSYGSSHFAGSESLFSDHLLTDSKQSLQIGSKSDSDQRCELIEEESEDAIQYHRSFNLDIQEDSTLPLDHDVRIKNPDVSESDSDLQSNRSDQAMISGGPEMISGDRAVVESGSEDGKEDDHELVVKAGHSIDHQPGVDDSESDDGPPGAGSLSSNEPNVVSFLSGNHLLSGDYPVSTSESIDNEPGSSLNHYQSDSDDEVLKRSRKNLRRSILAQPQLFAKRESWSGHSLTYEKSRDLEDWEVADDGGENAHSLAETSELGTCEKHGSGKLEVRKCTCMLSAGEQLEYDEHVKIASDHMQNGNELDAVMAYMEALKIADHDLEIRQRLCSVGLRYCNDEYSPQ